MTVKQDQWVAIVPRYGASGQKNITKLFSIGKNKNDSNTPENG